MKHWNSIDWRQAYFTTARRFSIVCASGVAFVHGFSNLCPTWKARWCMEAGQGLGMHSAELNPEADQILTDLCNKMNINSDAISMFYVSSDYGWASGWTCMPAGALIGVPLRCSLYMKPEALKNIRETLRREKLVDMKDKVTSRYSKLLVPQRDQMIGQLGGQLARIKSCDSLKNLTFTLGWFFGFYKLGLLLPRTLRLQPVPLKLIATIHSVCCLLGFVSFRPAYLLLKKHEIMQADERVASLGQEYSCAVIGNLQHQMRVNRLKRRVYPLLEYRYAENGNELGLLTIPTYSQRLERMKRVHGQRYNTTHNAGESVS